ncbi:transcriptional regulator DEF1 isoform X1 [Drosophila grimshawi]|nr:transcriptional regulator DEF1 isoform X1 [Drosophila grimshawi]XP_032598876.1 transcriptional regulator DEF1 isoform X1 [Drosophila grimshawi]
MSNLRICKAMSLHPCANLWQPEPATADEVGHIPFNSRICLMGCNATPAELRRFPVHDINRCNHWLRHFAVSDQLVEALGGLKKLRICFRHFSQRKEMAKTRMKTTPMRASKPNKITTGEAIATSATTAAPTTTSSTTAIDTIASANPLADSTTIELVDCSTGKAQKQSPMEKSVTTITPVPQRSHSTCSSSSVSSDVQSIGSDYEANLPLNIVLNTQAVGRKGKATTNGLAKKRKLYLITEKSDEKNGNSGQPNGQKRKMFVLVEQEKDSSGKKLMIVTDKQQSTLTQHLEKYLPEILSCIQGKEQAQVQAQAQAQVQAQAQTQAIVKQPTIKAQQQPAKQEPLSTKPIPIPSIAHKPHITLPPKKNPTNFVKLEESAVITPPPTSVSSLPVVQPVKESTPPPPPLLETETSINLSPDFRFLMKILPKLEHIPEPHKQHVKRSIQIFIEKSFSHYGKKD